MPPLPRLSIKSNYYQHIRQLALLLILSWTVTGCSKDFEQYYQATKLRLFAIVAEKPMLKPKETTKIEAIAYTPNDPSKTTYEWSWCPLRTSASDRYKCPISRDKLVKLVKEKFGSSIPIDTVFTSFTLPPGKTTTFTYPGPLQGVKFLCETLLKAATKAQENYGVSLPTYDCTRNFDIDIKLVMRNGDEELIAVKRISLWLGEKDINENPKIVSLQIRPSEGESVEELRKKGVNWIPTTSDRDKMWYTLPPNGVTPIVAEGKFELRSLVDPATIQTWTPPKRFGSDKELPPEKEAIKFSWFVNQSSVVDKKQSLVYRDGKTKLEDVSNIDWVPQCRKKNEPSTFPNCDEITVWSVIRDGRLGTAITSRQFKISGQLPKRKDDDE